MNQFHQLHKLKNLRKLHQLHKLPQLHWIALPAETTTYKNQQQLQQEVVGMLIYQRLNLALCQVSLSRSLNCNSHMRTVSKYRVIFNWVSKIIRNYIGFAFTFTFTSLCDWSKTLTPLNQSDAKLKPITTWSPPFSRALDSLVFLTSGSHWLFQVFSFLLIGLCDNLAFGFTTLNRKTI